MLRLRFDVGLWSKVSAVREDFDKVIERLVATHGCSLLEPRPVVVRGTVATCCLRCVLVSGGYEFLLQRPREGLGEWD